MPEQLKTLTSPWDTLTQSVGLGPCLSDDDILAFVLGELDACKIDRVHAHVDECGVCQRLVAEAAHAVDSEPVTDSERPSWNTVFQRNSVVSKRYRVLRLIARGGMGEVYEAYDTALQERVALKTVTSTACDSTQALRLLKAEVQLARRISHPNVCRIYDLGSHVMQTGAEIQFLVMEFVEGECLGKKLRETGALPLEIAQSIARQLLYGLRAAHQAGILHRDFKSDNVILRKERSGRITPVILDFGLAKVLNESGHIASTQGNGHAMVGTIGYMAPEQIEGEPLSRASDLYALGVVWFEMLTGHLPFEGSTLAASALARLHRSAHPPSSINPMVPKSLDDIVLRCLNRSRDTRYDCAEAVLDALTVAVDAPQSEPPKTQTPLKHRRLYWGLGLAVTAVTLVVVVTGSKPTLRPATWPEALLSPEKPNPVTAFDVTEKESGALNAELATPSTVRDSNLSTRAPSSLAVLVPTAKNPIVKRVPDNNRGGKVLDVQETKAPKETEQSASKIEEPANASAATTLPPGWLPLTKDAANVASKSEASLQSD